MEGITLTEPVTAAEVKLIVPEVRSEDDATVDLLLELEETSLRAQFGVLGTDAETDAALRRAMLAGFPSFRHQFRQVAQEAVSADGATRTNARTGVIDFVWPAFVGSILAGFVSETENPSQVPSVTELVR